MLLKSQIIPAIQKILKEGAVKFAIENRKISRPDTTPFREATKPVYDEWTPIIGKDLIDKVLAAAK